MNAVVLIPTLSHADALVIQKRASDLSLWTHPNWRALLHLTSPPEARSDRSLVQSEHFFLAKNGKKDARAELMATIDALFSPSNPGDDHPQCLFPARVAFLTEQIPQIVDKLPQVECPEFKQWSQSINAERITLIFPSYFVNNPASAFGHTLIRFDQRNRRENERLLAYAANFAAHADPADNALIYAAKGLFGGYSGYFSVEPYYNKVTQYNDLEDRDIWEYELTLTPQEVETIVKHLWELRRVAFSYYYFDENCSFALLSLLQVARPSLALTAKFPTWVLPVDTVRVLVEDPTLIGAIHFRPSKALMLRHLDQSAPPQVRIAATRIAQGQSAVNDPSITGLQVHDYALSLDIAYEYVNYRILAKPEKSTELRERAHAILLARSTLDAPVPSSPPIPETRPEQGHRTMRASIGTGFSEDALFGTLEVRPVYHELLDPPAGYLAGGEMVLGKFQARLTEGEGVELEEVDVLRATSLTPRDAFIRPLSWRLELGAHRRATDTSRTLVGRLWGGAGVTFNLSNTLTYALATLGTEGGEYYNSTFTGGVGGEGGIIYNPSQRWGFATRSWYEQYGLGESFASYGIEGEIRFGVAKDRDIRISSIQEHDIGGVANTTSVNFDVFF